MECDRWSRGIGVGPSGNDPRRRALLKGANLDDNGPVELATFVPQNATETELEEIDGIDEWRLQIQEGDKVIEDKLDQVLEQSKRLEALSRQISHEYEVLGVMIDEMDGQMDGVHEKLTTTTEQAKETRKKLATAKNCCIDICLFLIIVMLIGYLIWKYI